MQKQKLKTACITNDKRGDHHVQKANGEHSLYFDKEKNQYRGQIVIGRDERGKLRRKSVYGKTKKEVREKLNQIEFGIQTGTFVDKSAITFYQLAKQILDDERNLNYIKTPTYFRHMETLKQLRGIYHTPLQQMNDVLIKDFLLKNQDYAQSTINKQYTMMQRTFREAVDRGILTKNPMERLRKPKSTQKREKVRALTVEEQRRMMAVLTTEDVQYSQQMLLSMLTGMRMGEINALEASDVFLEFGVISVHKTISRGERGQAILNPEPKTSAGERKIPITDDVGTILRECLMVRPEGLLFLQNGQMITTNQVNAQYQRMLKKYDLIDDTVPGKVDLHSLRHTYATRCIEAGMQPKVLQLLLGHTDITITMNTYCDAFDAYREDNIAKAADYLKGMGLTLNEPQTAANSSKKTG